VAVSAPPVGNGSLGPATAPAAVLPEAEPADNPAWDKLASDTEDAVRRPDTAPRPGRKSRVSPHQRPDVTPVKGASRVRLWWVLGGASLAAMLALGYQLAKSLSSGSTPSPAPRGPQRPTLVVNHSGKNNALPSLRAALQQVVKGPKDLGARILVQDDIAEGDLKVGTHNVSIEADGGKPVVWKFVAQDKSAIKLLTLNNAEGFRLKGFVLDGDNQATALVNLYGRCPGVALEDLTFKNFKKYGVWVTNCEGGPGDRQVSLSRLHFITGGDQTAIFFEVLDHSRESIPRNRFFSIRDCKFDGPGGQIRAANPNAIDQVELPPGVKVLHAH
jgi:hypothetical protein